MPTLSFYTQFDSASVELPALGDLAFTYYINSAADYEAVNKEWKIFVDDYLTIPFELDFKIQDIFISGMSYGDTEPWVISNMNCLDIAHITPLVDSLTSEITANHSSSCNNISLVGDSDGNLCINCREHCFDPKNGTLTLPATDACYGWEWDGRITKHAVAIIFSSQDKVRFTVPSIEEVNITTYKNKIIVHAKTHSSEGGMIFCNAFLTALYPDASSISRSLLRT